MEDAAKGITAPPQNPTLTLYQIFLSIGKREPYMKRFLGELLPHFSKPRTAFLGDMFYGLMAGAWPSHARTHAGTSAVNSWRLSGFSTRPRPAGVNGIYRFLFLRVRGRTRVR